MKASPSLSDKRNDFCVYSKKFGALNLESLLSPSESDAEINNQIFDNAFNDFFSKHNQFFSSLSFEAWHHGRLNLILNLGVLFLFIFLNTSVLTLLDIDLMGRISAISIIMFCIISSFIMGMLDIVTHNLFKKMNINFKEKNLDTLWKILYIYSIVLNNNKYPFSQKEKESFMDNIVKNFEDYSANDFKREYVFLFNKINEQILTQEKFGYKSVEDLKNNSDVYSWCKEQEVFLKSNVNLSGLEKKSVDYSFEDKDLFDCLSDSPFITKQQSNAFVVSLLEGDDEVYKLDKVSFKESLLTLSILLNSDYFPQISKKEKMERLLAFANQSYSFSDNSWNTNKDLVFLISLQRKRKVHFSLEQETKDVSFEQPIHMVDMKEMQKSLFFK